MCSVELLGAVIGSLLLVDLGNSRVHMGWLLLPARLLLLLMRWGLLSHAPELLLLLPQMLQPKVNALLSVADVLAQ